MLLTFAHNVELRKAEWSEFDLDRAGWRIPAERMKMQEAAHHPTVQAGGRVAA